MLDIYLFVAAVCFLRCRDTRCVAVGCAFYRARRVELIFILVSDGTFDRAISLFWTPCKTKH